VFTPEAQYSTYKKRLDRLPTAEQAYETQKAKMGEDFYRGANSSTVDQPAVPRKNVERMARDVHDLVEKRKTRSRRRERVDGANDVDYINERNRLYNKKLARHFGAYTAEIKQNLERGTAL